MTELKIDKLRFFVSDEEDRKRSSVWFAHHNGDDVYVSARTLGGHMKLSLHRDRNCQFGMVRRYAERLDAEGLTPLRPIRWIRPPTPERGAFHAASVFFPTDFLRRMGGVTQPGKLTFSLPIAPAGEALEVALFYSMEQPTALESRFMKHSATPLLYVMLPCGEYVSVVARHVPFDQKQIPDLRAAGPRMRPLDGAPSPGGSVENAYAILFGDHTDAHRAFSMVEVNGLTVARNA